MPTRDRAVLPERGAAATLKFQYRVIGLPRVEAPGANSDAFVVVKRGGRATLPA